MNIAEETLKNLGVSSKKEVSLDSCKNFHGLKKADRLSSQLLHMKLCDAGFTYCVADICLHWKRDDQDIVVVGGYVDDLLVTGAGAAAVDRFFASLSSLSIENLGQVSKFLGKRVVLNDDGGCVIKQVVSIFEALRERWLSDASSTRAPFGADCHEVHPSDSALLEIKDKNGLPAERNVRR